MELARHYGFAIDPTPPRSPKKKGIVESGVKYVKSNFFGPRDFVDIDDCRSQLKTWLKTVGNARNHGTTHRRPVDMLRAEVKTLRRLPKVRFEAVWWERLKVRQNAHVVCDRRQYSVPWTLIGQKVDLKINDSEVIVFHEHQRVAQHRHPEIGEAATEEAHLPEHRVAQRHRSLEYWREHADSVGPATRSYVDAICSSDPAISQTRRVIKALTLLGTLPADRQESVCAHAVRFGNTKYRALKTIIADELDIGETTPPEEFEIGTGATMRFARGLSFFIQAAIQKGADHGYN
ncbi:MAG TPA: transposase [Dehalococcoidia bacterium]|nr:transposase [Dehalococcoidia bacterium]